MPNTLIIMELIYLQNLVRNGSRFQRVNGMKQEVSQARRTAGYLPDIFDRMNARFRIRRQLAVSIERQVGNVW